MSNTVIKIKRTSVAGRAANSTTLTNPGELALNMTDGIMYSTNGSVVFAIGANNTNVNVSNTLTVKAISANGSNGTSGHVLHSNGTATYWAADDQGVTSVATGNGLTGGTITTTGTISVIANNGLSANATGIYVVPGNGLIASNSTGVHVGQGTGVTVNSTTVAVNASYIATISSNNASFLGGTAAASYQLNSTLAANVATLASNSATYANASITNTFTVGTSTYFVSNGNVGIGTSSPSYKLQINGTISSTVSQTETHTFTGFQYKESFSDHVAQSKKTSNTYAYYWRTSDDGTLGGTNLKSIAEWYNDRLVFYTNNAERMRITATGNVGIGTNSPGHTIHASASSASVNIQDTGNTGAYIALTRGTGAFPASGAASLSQFNGSLFVKNLDTGPVIFTTTSSDTERMRITNDGNVGIGNSAPIEKLQIQGNILVQNGAASSNTSRNAGIRFWTDNAFGAELHYGDGLNQSGGYATAFYGRKSDSVSVRIGAYPASNTSQNTFSEYITVLNTGNIGIGNTAPAHKLRVQGDISLSGGIHANGSLGTSGQILTSNGTAAYWSSGGSGVTSVATGNGLTGGPITSTGTVSVLANTGIVANTTGLYVNSAYIGTIASNSATYANGSITNTFTVGTSTYFVSNGNVGIGTSSPYTNLTISNNVNGSSVQAVSSSLLHIVNESENATRMVIDQYGSAGAPNLIQRKARGTPASPSALLEGDVMLNNAGFGRGSTGWSSSARAQMLFVADENWSDTNQGSRIVFNTANNNTTSPSEKLRITANGDVGIGTTTPSSKLHVNGEISATSFNSLSDQTLKKDVENISDALELVTQMRGIKFTWKDSEVKSSGVLAQELEKITPDLVNTNNSGIKSVNYDGIIAYLIEAVKEIKDRLDTLNK